MEGESKEESMASQISLRYFQLQRKALVFRRDFQVVVLVLDFRIALHHHQLNYEYSKQLTCKTL